MNVPTDPTSVNASRLTTAHLQELRRARARALETYATATATAERISITRGIEEPLMAIALLSERLAKDSFDAVDRLCTQLDPEQTPVPEAIE